MKLQLILFLFIMFIFMGCASDMDAISMALNSTTMKIERLDQSITLSAVQNYLPPGVSMMPAYTIYEESIWLCDYKATNGCYVCCSEEPFSAMSPWKYCLVVDENGSALGFYELGKEEYAPWSTKKDGLFQKVTRDLN